MSRREAQHHCCCNGRVLDVETGRTIRKEGNNTTYKTQNLVPFKTSEELGVTAKVNILTFGIIFEIYTPVIINMSAA